MMMTMTALSRRTAAITVAALWLLILPHASGQLCVANGRLCDTHERCSVWKEEGECIRERVYMQKHCPASCSNFEQDVDEKYGDDECEDLHERCHLWAQAGECDENEEEMQEYCPKSCGLCPGIEGVATINLCVDKNDACETWAKSEECNNNPRYMEANCAKSCGLCGDDEEGEADEGGEEKQVGDMSDDDLVEKTVDFGVKQTAEGSQKRDTLSVIRESIEYMKEEASQLPASVFNSCLNRKELCAFWAVVGECEKNPAYMVTNCAPSCKTCHLIDMDSRCPKLDDAIPALKPGDLNNMFERIVETAPGNRTLTDEERRELSEQGIPEYTVHIYSRPESTDDDETLSPKNDKAQPPWVIYFDNFTTPEECQTLIELGAKEGYERSKDVGRRKGFDGTYDAVESTGRTSENAWCSHRSGCRDDETVQKVMNRMSTVMGIPPENSEDLQMLRYEKDQFYQTHHDFIDHQRDRQCGPRILTFFLYLSDVEAGGGTRFTTLDLTVTPKVGRALLWPSVLNSEPMRKDGRTMHTALPVEAGVKYAANGWIHMFDYLGPQSRGCN